MHEAYENFFRNTTVKGCENLFQNDTDKKRKSNEMPDESNYECDYYVKPSEKSVDSNVYYPMKKSVRDFLKEGTSIQFTDPFKRTTTPLTPVISNCGHRNKALSIWKSLFTNCRGESEISISIQFKGSETPSLSRAILLIGKIIITYFKS